MNRFFNEADSSGANSDSSYAPNDHDIYDETQSLKSQEPVLSPPVVKPQVTPNEPAINNDVEINSSKSDEETHNEMMNKVKNDLSQRISSVKKGDTIKGLKKIQPDSIKNDKKDNYEVPLDDPKSSAQPSMLSKSYNFKNYLTPKELNLINHPPSPAAKGSQRDWLDYQNALRKKQSQNYLSSQEQNSGSKTIPSYNKNTSYVPEIPTATPEQMPDIIRQVENMGKGTDRLKDIPRPYSTPVPRPSTSSTELTPHEKEVYNSQDLKQFLALNKADQALNYVPDTEEGNNAAVSFMLSDPNILDFLKTRNISADRNTLLKLLKKYRNEGITPMSTNNENYRIDRFNIGYLTEDETDIGDVPFDPALPKQSDPVNKTEQNYQSSKNGVTDQEKFSFSDPKYKSQEPQKKDGPDEYYTPQEVKSMIPDMDEMVRKTDALYNRSRNLMYDMARHGYYGEPGGIGTARTPDDFANNIGSAGMPPQRDYNQGGMPGGFSVSIPTNMFGGKKSRGGRNVFGNQDGGNIQFGFDGRNGFPQPNSISNIASEFMYPNLRAQYNNPSRNTRPNFPTWLGSKHPLRNAIGNFASVSRGMDNVNRLRNRYNYGNGYDGNYYYSGGASNDMYYSQPEQNITFTYNPGEAVNNPYRQKSIQSDLNYGNPVYPDYNQQASDLEHQMAGASVGRTPQDPNAIADYDQTRTQLSSYANQIGQLQNMLKSTSNPQSRTQIAKQIRDLTNQYNDTMNQYKSNHANANKIPAQPKPQSTPSMPNAPGSSEPKSSQPPESSTTLTAEPAQTETVPQEGGAKKVWDAVKQAGIDAGDFLKNLATKSAEEIRQTWNWASEKFNSGASGAANITQKEFKEFQDWVSKNYPKIGNAVGATPQPAQQTPSSPQTKEQERSSTNLSKGAQTV